MPTVRQKWARLVQQPMLTCWQASTSCPVAGSVNDPARPPSRCRDSSTVTRNPRGASATAAARPGEPAADDQPPSRRSHTQPHFAGHAEGVAAPWPAVRPAPGGRTRRSPRRSISSSSRAVVPAITRKTARPSADSSRPAASALRVVAPAPGRPGTASAPGTPGRAGPPRLRRAAEPLQFVGAAGRPGRGPGPRPGRGGCSSAGTRRPRPRPALRVLGVHTGPQAPDADARQPDRRRHPVAVRVQLGERGEPHRLQVRLDAVDHVEQVLRRDRRRCGRCGAGRRVAGASSRPARASSRRGAPASQRRPLRGGRRVRRRGRR